MSRARANRRAHVARARNLAALVHSMDWPAPRALGQCLCSLICQLSALDFVTAEPLGALAAISRRDLQSAARAFALRRDDNLRLVHTLVQFARSSSPRPISHSFCTAPTRTDAISPLIIRLTTTRRHDENSARRTDPVASRPARARAEASRCRPPAEVRRGRLSSVTGLRNSNRTLISACDDKSCLMFRSRGHSANSEL